MRSLEILEKTIDRNHLSVGRPASILAVVYMYQGELGSAILRAQQAHRVLLANLGPRHPDTLTSQFRVGTLDLALDRAAALQQAQVQMIQSRRKAGQPAHPFFWAAFTLTGP